MTMYEDPSNPDGPIGGQQGGKLEDGNDAKQGAENSQDPQGKEPQDGQGAQDPAEEAKRFVEDLKKKAQSAGRPNDDPAKLLAKEQQQNKILQAKLDALQEAYMSLANGNDETESVHLVQGTATAGEQSGDDILKAARMADGTYYGGK